MSFIWPAQNPELMQKLPERNVTVMAMDSVPRISRAQSLDALSSMANIAGYVAVFLKRHMNLGASLRANYCGRESATGKSDGDWCGCCRSGRHWRSKQSRRDCACIRHPPGSERTSLKLSGAEFLELDFKEEAGSGDGYAKVMSDAFIKAEMELFAAQAKEVDIIVTTALIPGKPAPKLITVKWLTP